MSYTYKFPRPNLTVDIVLIRIHKVPPESEYGSEVLLIERGNKPFKGKLALPGGFMDMNETLEAAAYRELKEETGIDLTKETDRMILGFRGLRFLKVYDAPNRDPRGRTISAAFCCFVDKPLEVIAGDDAVKAIWVPKSDVEDLAFDHMDIISDAYSTTLPEFMLRGLT